MSETICKQGTRRICEPNNPVCEERIECLYLPSQVEEKLRPQELDGNVSTYTEAEKASLAYALQPFEIKPSGYEIFEGKLGEIRERMQTAFQAFQKKVATPQIVWLSMDAATQKRLISQNKNSDLFLKQMKNRMEKELKPFGVSVVDSRTEPRSPHSTIIYADKEESLVATRERRVQAVKATLFSDNPKMIQKLREILDWVQKVARPEASTEDLYDMVGMQSDFGGLIYMAGGWAPIDREDAANIDPGGFAFVQIHPSQVFQPKSLAHYTIASVHELGHLWGLEHANVIHFFRGEDVLIMNSHLVGFQEEERVREDILRYQKSLKDPKKSEREKHSIRTILDELQKNYSLPRFVWGEQAPIYLKAALK